MAGLKKGDFLLEINNEDVSSASHEHVVDLIRKSGNLVQMTVSFPILEVLCCCVCYQIYFLTHVMDFFWLG